MWSIGIDVHLRKSQVCILNGQGKLVKQTLIYGPWTRVVEFLRSLDHAFAVCYEASCGYGNLYDALRKITRRVVVAHPGQLRLIFRSKQKNDRADARKLATLLFLDQVPGVYVPSVDVRSWRQLIEFRRRLIDKRTRVKNALRALLRSHGLTPVYGKGLWTRKGRAWLEGIELPTEAAALQRDLLLDELSHLEVQVVRVTKRLDDLGGRHPGVFLLRTIPGVGPRTSEAVVAYMDDASRFTRNKKVGSYFGLVPCQDQSADRNRLGHITRQGPGTVRKLLTEAGWQAIRHSPHVAAYFDRIQGGDPGRKKIALVATAHYLVRVMHAMLLSGECWRHDKPAAPAA